RSRYRPAWHRSEVFTGRQAEPDGQFLYGREGRDDRSRPPHFALFARQSVQPRTAKATETLASSEGNRTMGQIDRAKGGYDRPVEGIFQKPICKGRDRACLG